MDSLVSWKPNAYYLRHLASDKVFRLPSTLVFEHSLIVLSACLLFRHRKQRIRHLPDVGWFFSPGHSADTKSTSCIDMHEYNMKLPRLNILMGM